LLLQQIFLQPVWNAFRVKVLPPLLLVFVLAVDWIIMTLKKLRGDAGYLPVEAILSQASESQQQKQQKR